MGQSLEMEKRGRRGCVPLPGPERIQVASGKQRVNTNNLKKRSQETLSQKKQAQRCYKTVWFCNNFPAAGQ